MLENLFNGFIEAIFGSDPSATIQRVTATVFTIVGGLGAAIAGPRAYYEFNKSGKFNSKVGLLIIATIVGLVLAAMGITFFRNLSDAVQNNL